MRHAHASWLLAGGADVYLHSLPDADDKALAAFESIRDRAAR